MQSIARSAQDIQQVWNELGAIERSKNPAYLRYADEFDGGLPPGLDRLVSINWNGPLEPLVRRIAEDADYAFEVVGRRPATPISVSIVNNNPLPLGYVLRDAGYQAGDRAGVVLRSESIEIRYPQ